MQHTPANIPNTNRPIISLTDYAAHIPESLRPRVNLEPASEVWTWQDHEVRILRNSNEEAATRVIVVHGAGGHSEALWPIASLIPIEKFDVTAIDLPLYGNTISQDPTSVRYNDWVTLLRDFLASENDDRALILLGASIGGMLAYEVAATTDLVDRVVATCLIDPRDGLVRAAMTRFGMLGRVAAPLLRLLPKAVLRLQIPIGLVAPLSKMSANPELSDLCRNDPRGGGGRVPIGFLASLMSYRHAPPEQMKTPVTLAHPENDTWTPLKLSRRWFDRIAAPKELVVLHGASHFPIEEDGLRELLAAVSRAGMDRY